MLEAPPKADETSTKLEQVGMSTQTCFRSIVTGQSHGGGSALFPSESRIAEVNVQRRGELCAFNIALQV